MSMWIFGSEEVIDDAELEEKIINGEYLATGFCNGCDKLAKIDDLSEDWKCPECDPDGKRPLEGKIKPFGTKKVDPGTEDPTG